METKFARSYACLTVGYLEETRLFPLVLPKYFNGQLSKYIERNFFRYMDDGFLALPREIDPSLMKRALNELHPARQFTTETGIRKQKTLNRLIS